MSTTTVLGFVHKIWYKDGTSKFGKWFAYSFKVEDENGEVDPMFYQFDFNQECPFKEGDYVKFDAEPGKNDNAMKVVEGTGEMPDPPKRKAKAQGGNGAKVEESELFVEIGGYYCESDIRRMCYTTAREAAIKAVDVLLARDALPSSVAKSKAGQADRYKEAMAMIDKLTVRYFWDITGPCRLLETVADEGEVDLSPDADLPDASDRAVEKPSGLSDDDDSPPPDTDDEESSEPRKRF